MIDIYIEIISLIIGIIGLLYVFGIMEVVDHKLYYGWRLIFIAYIFFILGKIIRILEYAKILDATNYRAIPGLLFIISATIGIIYFNRKIMKILIKKRK